MDEITQETIDKLIARINKNTTLLRIYTEDSHDLRNKKIEENIREDKILLSSYRKNYPEYFINVHKIQKIDDIMSTLITNL